jgi:hypothetical protein
LETDLKIRNPGISKEDITFEKNNFKYLDQARCFLPDSFDFIIQSIGVFSNRKIVSLALDVLIKKLSKMINEKTPVIPSETTMMNCFDIILIDEDYTIGKMI